MGLHKGEVAGVEGPGGGPVIAEGGGDQLRHRTGDRVRGDGDEADAAEGEDGESEGVVTGQDGEIRRCVCEELGDLHEVAAGLFDTGDVG